MTHAIAVATLAGWAPAVLLLFRAIGPRRAAVAAVLAGWLLLPRGYGYAAFGFLELGKRTITGLAPALAVLLLDRPALRGARPRWRDLPMIAFVLVPLVAAAAGGFQDLAAAAGQSWVHLTAWALPYALGRIYYAPGGGTRDLAIAAVVAALLMIPPLLYETIAGPSHFLAGLIYGLAPNEGMVRRLGGIRPELLMLHGLELAAWMALAAVLATWLAACRDGWRPAAYLAAPALILATLACRGVYGYATLAVGLLVAAITAGLNTRWALAALLLIPPTYAVARASGLWDGRALASAAARTGRETTVSMRLDTEDQFLRDTRAAGWVFGAGGRYPEWASDGLWVMNLKGGGLAGLAAFYAALIWPVAWSLARRPARSVESGLVLFVALHVLDTLHNTSLVVASPLFCGALLGSPPVVPAGGEGAPASGTVRYRIR